MQDLRAVEMFDPKGFGIGREPFVQPEFTPVAGGDGVSPPFVCHFMHRHEIEVLLVPAQRIGLARPKRVRENRAHGNRCGVFHSRIGRLHQREFLVPKSKRSEPVLVLAELVGDSRKEFLTRFCCVLAEYVVEERVRAIFPERLFKNGVRTDVQSHQVREPWVVQNPFARFPAVFRRDLANKAAVGYAEKRVRKREADPDGVRLVLGVEE